MEELFTLLSSSARLDKSQRKKKRKIEEEKITTLAKQHTGTSGLGHDDDSDREIDHETSRDRTGKRDTSEEKRQQIHKEKTAAFRRTMAIRIENKHDPNLPDPISSFSELSSPSWWKPSDDTFHAPLTAILRNVELGRWKEPTPVQMQSIPILMERLDLIGAAPTGSGKSGAFIIPALLLSSAPYEVYYGSSISHNILKKKKKKFKYISRNVDANAKSSREGEIRSLLLAPSRELAAQLHREVERLGLGKPGGISSILLAKSNASHLIGGSPGGKNGLDVLVSTPLRLVDAIEKGLRLDCIRLVVLDEADRLLDAADGKQADKPLNELSDEKDEKDGVVKKNTKKAQFTTDLPPSYGNTRTFLSQMDTILSAIPSSAARALFSATVTPTVKSLSDSILRNPIDLKIAAPGSYGGANTDIDQQLMFVGREEGKLLAIRQLKERGQLHPPCIVFVQSQERAQALFSELLYEGLHIDVIHAGRSKTARDNAVAKFRKGETWLLICTDLVARGVDFRAVNMVINFDLPSSGITYVHRIGRTGRAGRKGKAITLFTEADFENLRTIANVIKQSGCKVEDWMLQLKKSSKKSNPRRQGLDTTPWYDKRKRRKQQQMIEHSKKQKQQVVNQEPK